MMISRELSRPGSSIHWPWNNEGRCGLHGHTMTLEAVRYTPGSLLILDQLLLPHETTYVSVRDTEDGWRVIKNMQVKPPGRDLLPV